MPGTGGRPATAPAGPCAGPASGGGMRPVAVLLAMVVLLASSASDVLGRTESLRRKTQRWWQPAGCGCFPTPHPTGLARRVRRPLPGGRGRRATVLPYESPD